MEEPEVKPEAPRWFSMAEAHKELTKIADRAMEWSGIPYITAGERYRFRPESNLLQAYQAAVNLERNKETETETASPKKESTLTFHLVNWWQSKRGGHSVTIYRAEDASRTVVKYIHTKLNSPNKFLGFTLGSVYNAYTWPEEAEANAMKMLKGILDATSYHAYLMCGQFIQESNRSGLTYLFRRGMPTIAYRDQTETEPARVLCALCSHGVGYIENSFAGVLCPTDDVIQHLLLMRADEPRFWKVSEQHPIWQVESAFR